METLSPARAAWRRALHDPALRDLPYEVETNEYGQLVMSPVKLVHGELAGEIAGRLREVMRGSGRVLIEVGVDTRRGVKASDVAWMSGARRNDQPQDAEALEVAPEICVEVLSRSNTQAEIDEKRALYLSCGAEEVWTCDSNGRMRV